MDGNRLDAPAFRRNWRPIVEIVDPLFKTLAGDALEVGCGSGQHATVFSMAYPDVTWWPSDPDSQHRASADAWRQDCVMPNHRPAIALDVTATAWPLGGDGQPSAALALIYAFNVIHIAPWAVAEGLFAGAGRHLANDGMLVLYGPYKRDGRHTAPSNEAFDESLRARDPSWGVRDLDAVTELAEMNGLKAASVHEMPANNLIVVFRR